MHVLVHLPLLTSSPVAGHVYPPGMAVAGVVRQNYHLRACWYAVLEEASEYCCLHKSHKIVRKY